MSNLYIHFFGEQTVQSNTNNKLTVSKRLKYNKNQTKIKHKRLEIEHSMNGLFLEKENKAKADRHNSRKTLPAHSIQLLYQFNRNFLAQANSDSNQ